jgi:hypothetical protein
MTAFFTLAHTSLAQMREEWRDRTGFSLEMLSLQGRKTKRERKSSWLFLHLTSGGKGGLSRKGIQLLATPTQTRVTLTDENICMYIKK